MRDPRGFTLLELLVALAVLGMIALMLTGSTQYGLAAWHRTDSLGVTAGELTLVRTIVARGLGRAYPERSVDQSRTDRVAFDGTDNRLSFLASVPQSLGGAGLARFTLSSSGDDGAKRLELSAARELGTVDPSTSVLIDRAARVEFAYYGPTGSGAEPSWQPDWHGRAETPKLIRIHVEFPEGDARQWPDLIVAPGIAEDATCVYDPLSYHCRGR